MERGQADRAMRVMPVTRVVERAVLGLRSRARLAVRMEVLDGPSVFNGRARSRLDDVEDKMDRQKHLDAKRGKTEPRTKSCLLYSIEHQPKHIMEFPPPAPNGS